MKKEKPKQAWILSPSAFKKFPAWFDESEVPTKYCYLSPVLFFLNLCKQWLKKVVIEIKLQPNLAVSETGIEKLKIEEQMQINFYKSPIEQKICKFTSTKTINN